MGIWANHVAPRLLNKACARADLIELRRRVLSGVHGEVLDIGFGSGHNVGHYPAGVEKIMAVEPSMLAASPGGRAGGCRGDDVHALLDP